MQKILSDWKNLFYNIALVINGVLLFVLLFEHQFVVPFWMQALGRLHPLVLHFPLVVLVLYNFWIIIIRNSDSSYWNVQLADSLLIIGTLTAAIASFSGLVLSQEEGYASDALQLHKWLGVAISLVSIIWYSLRRQLVPWKPSSKVIASLFVVLIFAGGHLGGNLTHGEDFLISPWPSANKSSRISFEEANVYENMVKPVLEQKCLSCHNQEKSKGSLQMQTRELLAKGGKGGVLWDTSKVDLGLLISRLHLPLDDKKHMPPKGKVQLTAEEIELLTAWVKGGSRFDQLVSTLSPQSPTYAYAKRILGNNESEDQYDFSAADPEKIQKLNTNYRLIKPLSSDSPGLLVNFYNRAEFKSEDIKALMPLKSQIVSMDLSRMPINDQDLKTLAEFPELRKLILNFTDIKGNSLNELKKLKNLKELSLTGTAIKMAHVKALESIPSLKKVYIWNTDMTTDELAKLKEIKNIQFETGFRSDTVILALNAPIIETEKQLIGNNEGVVLKHKISGAVIRYTLDGSEPDSLKSLVYDKPIAITQNSKLRTRAFRKGWYGSPEVNKMFFKAGYAVDSAKLHKPVDIRYQAKGAKSLIDGKLGNPDMGSGTWLGFNNNEFQGSLYFINPVKTSNITISMLRSIRSYIFPPKRIEVWGGENEKSVKLLKVITPEMPTKDIPEIENLNYEVNFEPQELGYIKVIAEPLVKIPQWHPGKGQRAWVFVDEIIVR